MGTITEEFHDAFVSGGAGSFTCECGRHYGPLVGEYDEGGGAMVLDCGSLIAEGCECGKDVAIERWLWDNRDKITKFLIARGKRESAAYLEMAAAGKTLAAALEAKP